MNSRVCCQIVRATAIAFIASFPIGEADAFEIKSGSTRIVNKPEQVIGFSISDSGTAKPRFEQSSFEKPCDIPCFVDSCTLDSCIPKQDPAGLSCIGECGEDCLPPWWVHRERLFAEYLWLRPGSTDIIFATEQTDPDPSVASPTGPLGILDMDAESGFRVGFSLPTSNCSSFLASFARWDGSVISELEASGGNVLSSNLIHPSSFTSGAASLEAVAEHKINFQTADVLYRRLWKHSNALAVNWLAGIRYGNIEQQLSSDQTVSVASGLTNVTTDIDFNGFGISGGLDFETCSCATGFSFYGRTLASLLAGEWNATYAQTNQFGGGVIANSYEDFHATPTLEAELGVRWMAKKRHFMISAGFLMSGWYESLTTRSYIDSVRAGQLTDAGETMTFSGLTARAEWRF